MDISAGIFSGGGGFSGVADRLLDRGLDFFTIRSAENVSRNEVEAARLQALAAGVGNSVDDHRVVPTGENSDGSTIKSDQGRLVNGIDNGMLLLVAGVIGAAFFIASNDD